MEQFIDLSHPITDRPSCTLSLSDTVPKVHFQEREVSKGVLSVTSILQNMGSDVGTHIDLPGQLVDLSGSALVVGDYAPSRFVGEVLVIDVADKLDAIKPFFNVYGKFTVDAADEETMLAFLQSLERLQITARELDAAAERCGVSLTDLKGVLLFSGLSAYWKYEICESWQELYFFNPYLAVNACQLLADSHLSFVGIDAFHLEDPICNYGGDEAPLVLNPKCREIVAAKLERAARWLNHRLLLENDVLIYENLRIPKQLKNRTVKFSGVPLNIRLKGVTDNALVRPYVEVN